MTLKAIQKRDDGDSKGKKLIAFVIGGIMLMSVAGFIVGFSGSSQSGANSFRHGGLLFQQSQQGTFFTEVNGNFVEFFYLPEDLVNMEVSSSVISKLTGSKVLTVSYDWNTSLTEQMALLQFDLVNIFDAQHEIFVQPALTTENPFDIEVTTCEGATSFVPVLLIQEANNTAISIDTNNPNCVVLNGTSGFGFVRVADKLKYIIIAGE
jgi:hypothetical protein